MKLLLGSNLSHRVARLLRDADVDAVHVREHNLQHATDATILEFAREHPLVAIFEDTDFGELLAQQRTAAPSFVGSDGYASLLYIPPGWEGPMSQRKRNARRRPEPLRRPVQAPQPATADSDAPELAPVTEDLLLPEVSSFVSGTSSMLPVEVTPLYTTLAAIYHAIGGRTTYPGIAASGQLVRGLEYLGFEAELFPAYTKIFLPNRGRVGITEFDVWDSQAIPEDGASDGHLVVWTASFNRCIDLAVCQDRTLLRASVDGKVFTLPVVLPMSGDHEQLLCGAKLVGAERPPFRISWEFLPDRRPRFDPLLAHHAAAIEHGGLALAHIVVDLLSAFAVRHDLSQLDDLYPRLSGLLSGRLHLPELEDYSPRRESGADAPPEVTEERRDNLGHL